MYFDKSEVLVSVLLASDPADAITPRDAFQHVRTEHDAPQGRMRILQSRNGAEGDKKPIPAGVRPIQDQTDRASLEAT